MGQNSELIKFNGVYHIPKSISSLAESLRDSMPTMSVEQRNLLTNLVITNFEKDDEKLLALSRILNHTEHATYCTYYLTDRLIVTPKKPSSVGQILLSEICTTEDRFFKKIKDMEEYKNKEVKKYSGKA